MFIFKAICTSSSKFEWQLTQNKEHLEGFPLFPVVLTPLSVFGSSLVLFLLASFLATVRLWHFQEKINSGHLSLAGCGKSLLGRCLTLSLELISPRHITDSVMATFKPRSGRRNLYLLAMMVVMIILCMATNSENYCQFMYTKRMFQWKMDRYSYFTMVQTIVTTSGAMLIMPLFHHFNVNDSVIILACSVSMVATRLIKALATTEEIFFASNGVAMLLLAFYAPVRAQMTRCVPSQDLGKVRLTLTETVQAST